MDLSHPFLNLIAVLAGAALLVLFVLTYVPAYRAARARSMSTRVGLALDDSVRGAVERSVAIRLRATALFAVVGLGVGWVAMVASPIGPVQQWFMHAGLFLGLGAGSAVGALLARPRTATSGARYARSRDVRLSDYVMPFELTGARILVAAGAVTAALVAALLVGVPREATSLLSLIVVTALAIGALIVFEIAGRAIIGQPSPAESPTSLAWEDALRADSLRNLVTAPLLFGCVAVALTVVGAFGLLPLGPVSIILGAAIPMLLLVGAVVVIVMSVAAKPQQHFLRVLWPETAAAGAR